jgi:hypothetical protein
MKLLSTDFILQMEKELQNNQHKGNWLNWFPTKEESLSELDHHVLKLKIALLNNNTENIKEYSADVANISEKIFTQFGS